MKSGKYLRIRIKITDYLSHHGTNKGLARRIHLNNVKGRLENVVELVVSLEPRVGNIIYGSTGNAVPLKLSQAKFPFQHALETGGCVVFLSFYCIVLCCLDCLTRATVQLDCC